MKLLLAAAFLIGSPALAQTEPDALGFEAALSAIVDRNPTVASQRATVESVKARNLPSHLSLLPTVSLEADAGATRQFGITTSRMGATAKAGLNIFKFGGDAAAMRAANSEDRAEELTLESTILQTEASGVAALLAVIQTRQEVDVLSKIEGMWQDTLKIGHERYDRGLLPSQEVDKISIDLDNAQAALRDAEIAAIQAEASLDNLLGHHHIRREWPWKARLLAHPEAFSGLTDSELGKRPDWQSAEKRVQAARDRMKQSWAGLLPSLDTTFSYGYYRTNPEDVYYGGSSTSPTPTLSTGTYVGPEWAGMITLTIPLFDRLQTYGSYKVQVSAQATAEQDLEKVRRQAKSDWDSARGSFDTAVRSARRREQTLATSQNLYRDSLERFRKGLANANELNVDQTRLFNTETSAIRGWGAAHSGLAHLCQALGRRIEKCLHE